MGNIRRRTLLLFLTTAVLSICLYVFFHKDYIPSIQECLAEPHIDTSYTAQAHKFAQDAAAKPPTLPAGQPFVKHNPEALTPASERPLITYAYFETDFARQNLIFFLAHALHDAADFIFILNGDTDVEKLIFADPYADVPPDIRHLFPHPTLSNVFVKKRPNTCFDIGAHAEVLESAIGEDKGWIGANGHIRAPIHKDAAGKPQLLRHGYSRFILLNASIRGPFFPPHSHACWSDVYLNRLTPRVKLVGMAYNCHGGDGHVQSMIWATDRPGMQLMLTKEGMGGECSEGIGGAMEVEVKMTKLFRDHEYEVDAFLSIYHSEDKKARWERMRARMQAGLIAEGKTKRGADDEVAAAGEDVAITDETHHPADDISARNQNYTQKLITDTLDEPGYLWRECKEEDWLGPGSYADSYVHPFENLFMKSHRGIADSVLGNLTAWTDGAGVNSWGVCR